jgi:hypothetical protein
MKRSIQLKVDKLVALSKQSDSSITVVRKKNGVVSDSLSNSIRSKRDAEIFRRELTSAFTLAKSKH